jgi:DNA-binding transcriptional ArsR family regulator
MPAAGSQVLDAVIHSLADPTLRALFERLGAEPGLTTNELTASVRGLSRWGVMKHLGVLRDAGLLQTLPEGRRRRHYRDTRPLRALAAWLDANR